MVVVSAYMYQPFRDLLYVDDRLRCNSKVNTPMNNKIIKIHRGVDNNIEFRVRTKDLKPACIDHLSVLAKIVNPLNNETMLYKYLTVGLNRGQMMLTIFEGDLVDIPPGFYHLLLQGENEQLLGNPDTVVASPFFTDTNDNIVYDIEVTGQASLPTQTVELFPKDWTPINAAEEPYTVYSSAISCNKLKNHKNSIHTFSILAQQFSGSLQVLGSLDMNPPTTLDQYFPVILTEGTNQIDFDNYTGTEAFTFESNVMWVKFRLIYDSSILLADNGSIDKILWRP